MRNPSLPYDLLTCLLLFPLVNRFAVIENICWGGGSEKPEINVKGLRFQELFFSPHGVPLSLRKTVGGSKYQNAWGYFYMLSVLFTACDAILEDLKPLWPYGPSPCLGTGVLVAAQQHFETPEPPSAHGRDACVLCQHWTTELCDFNMLTYSCNWS